MTVSKDQASTLLASDYKDPQCVAYQCSCEIAPTLRAQAHGNLLEQTHGNRGGQYTDDT